jgi:hypothetical protein
MNWLFVVLSFLMPMIQPVVQTGAQKLQARMQGYQQTSAVTKPQINPQPYITYHEGRWWKLENGQWYVWNPS